MNIFNRLVTVLLLLFLWALAVVIALFPPQAITVTQRGLELASAALNTLETSYSWLYSAGRIALVLLAVLIFGLLLWGELRPHRPRAVSVQTEAGSRGSVTTDSVSRRLAWHVDQVADVVSVVPKVTARGRSVDIVLDVETSPEIDVPMKTDEITGLVREVITERMGMLLGKIEVRLRHAPYPEET